MKTHPYYQRQRYGPGNFMRIFAEVPWKGMRQTTVGLSTTAIFSAFGRHIFGIFRDKTNIIIQLYGVLRRLSTDPKIRDLE